MKIQIIKTRKVIIMTNPAGLVGLSKINPKRIATINQQNMINVKIIRPRVLDGSRFIEVSPF